MNRLGLLGLLAVAVLVSALGVVFTKHESRRLFVQLQALSQVRDGLQVEWGQLQLEQSTWATDSRIERVARSELDMLLPPTGAVVIVKP